MPSEEQLDVLDQRPPAAGPCQMPAQLLHVLGPLKSQSSERCMGSIDSRCLLPPSAASFWTC